MFEMPPTSPPQPPPGTDSPPDSPRAPATWTTILAWLVILLTAAGFIALRSISQSTGTESGESDDPVGILILEIQAKYMVGAAALTSGSGALVYEQAKTTLNIGSVEQRLRFVILAAFLIGPEEAGERLAELEDELANPPRGEPVELTDDQKRVLRILHELYPPTAKNSDEEHAEGAEEPSEPAASDASQTATPSVTLSDDDREFLVQRLGWFGRLALVTSSDADPAARETVVASARRVMFTLLAAVIGAGCMGIAGFAGLVIFIVLAFQGRIRLGIGPGHAHHGIYAETFAVWMVLFVGLLLLVGLTPGGIGMNFIAFFGSLAALAWPVFRGVPWRQVRQDIGWTAGRAGWLEPLIGLASYVMSLPILAIGIGVTLVFLLIETQFSAPGPTFAPAGGPAHPVIAELTSSWWVRIQLLLLASVVAPIVEETMFRGVLYRHLRDATARAGMIASVLFSAFVNSLLFAAIHPQGWVAIPALASLAFGMTMAREWRGTLLPSMVVHGTSNGLVMTLLLVLIGS